MENILGKTVSGITWGKDDEGDLVISRCNSCGKSWTIKKDSKQYDRYMGENTASMINENVCNVCYRKYEPIIGDSYETYAERDRKKQAQILLGQAQNLATLTLAGGVYEFGSEEYWNEWYRRVAVFLVKLTEKGDIK